ncbi:MAG: hypothetical protein PF542_01980 [Nanoarchaeota archaeon]|jgi:pheromone shutdown protein TraB|nr:hypothetical protein [Nanoarchaeota archaeon]
MTEIFFIGTLHCGFTNENELKRIILDINPKLLLIEICQEDIKHNKISKYPKEMIFALNLAKENNISCKGFDSNINTIKKGISSENENKIIALQEKIIKQHSWEKFNNFEPNEKLTKISKKIIDLEKWNQGELEMKSNLKSLIPDKDTVLILTGTGHIPFFKKEFPNAKFPLSS